MEIGTWYQQVFTDKTIYFYVEKRQKNGGWAGTQVDVYPGSRGLPKKKKASIPNAPGFLRLWTPASEIPESISHLVTDE